MIELDGTDNKKNLGANAIWACRAPFAKPAAGSQSAASSLPGRAGGELLPVAMMKYVNGGRACRKNAVEMQEFMVMRWASEVQRVLRCGVEYVTAEEGVHTTAKTRSVGTKGGFART